MMLKVRDDVDIKNLAYLEDRVMLKEKGVQKYGTQLTRRDDHYELQPLIDKRKLDEFRAEVGLRPIREYLEDEYWSKKGEAFIDEEDYLQQTKKKQSK